MKIEEGKTSRRTFIKGLAAISGMAAVPSVAKGGLSLKSGKDKKFIYRTLGNTGIRLPVISMGVMNADNPRLVRAALNAGIMHLDTAGVYQEGRNEQMIGGVIKDFPRDSYVIATKVKEKSNWRTGLFPENADPAEFVRKFEASLKRLGLDYVDILYLHNIVRKEAALFEPYYNALIQLKKEGKTRFIGVSTHKNEVEVIRAATDSQYDVILTAYNYQQQHREQVKTAIGRAAKAGKGIIGMKAVAGMMKKNKGSGDETGADVKAALSWVLRDENIHTVIAGFTTFDQMETDLAVMQEMASGAGGTTKISRPGKGEGLYCQQCGSCLSQCPADFDIPTMMRSYMYNYGYRNRVAAKAALAERDLSAIACNTCDPCRVDCPMGFDIRRKVLDIARIAGIPDEFLC